VVLPTSFLALGTFDIRRPRARTPLVSSSNFDTGRKSQRSRASGHASSNGELTACDGYGLPNFHALHFHNRRSERCVGGVRSPLPRRRGPRERSFSALSSASAKFSLILTRICCRRAHAISISSRA